MKKLFLSAGLAFVSATAFGQGQVVFANNTATTITNLVTGLPASGSSAQDDTQVALYVGSLFSAENTFVHSGAATNCHLPGLFNGGTRTIAGWTGSAQLQIRSWLANTIYPTYEAALAAANSGDTSVVVGVSAPAGFILRTNPPINSVANFTPIVLAPPGAMFPPTIKNRSAVILGAPALDNTRTVQLSALVDPGAQKTSVKFLYGLASSYGGTNGPIVLPPAFTASNLTVTLPFSPGFTYHWSVVASNGSGLTLSPDQTFTIAATPSGISGDVNGDGIVSQSEFNAVYALYVTNSPWLSMTNVAGPDGTNVTFALADPALGAYSVESSTNLVNWMPLGLASPRYSFDDPNAPGPPTRHYRLRYP
jgi:hypothetical protein